VITSTQRRPAARDAETKPTGVVRLALGQTVQVEPSLDRTLATFQPFGIGAVDSGEAVHGWSG